jgi:hypothetical protein
MTRCGAAIALWAISSISMAEAAQDSSSCPPATSVQVTNVSATTYTMRISASNTCTCRIYFEACPADRPKRCKGGRISPGETKQFVLDISKADGKADYHWRCR